MATTYKTRKKCHEEDTNSVSGDFGHNKGWHYIYEDQTVLDPDVDCPDHALATTSMFVILEEEVT